MSDQLFFKRCYDLARKGGKSARPNPDVGCVIVHNNRIIGEGYHQQYGSHHAEVNAVHDIKEVDRHLLPKSTVYVTLEPCHHFGSTPPCVDLLIQHNVQKVNIALIDPTEKVNQKSVIKLRNAGIEVQVWNQDDEAKELLSVFNAVQFEKRPFVQLKIAKSKYNYIGKNDGQVKITNKYTNVYTHKLRAYTDAILIGTNTAEIDNPSLTTRNYPGPDPLRIILDRQGRLSQSSTLLSDDKPTLVVTENPELTLPKNKEILILDFTTENFIENLLQELLLKGIHHLFVEGGATLHKSFIKTNCWDQAIIISTQNKLQEGTKAPNIHGRKIKEFSLLDDNINIVMNNSTLKS